MAIHGAALGGGLETTMCGHYRIALPSVAWGVPEVKLGLIPGLSGTATPLSRTGRAHIRLSLDEGRPISTTEALACQLIDRIVHERTFQRGLVLFT